MKLGEVIERLGAEALVPGDETAEPTGAYISDLLSDVMAHARPGAIWITIQTHQNVIAVAALLNLAAVILAAGHKPDEETLAKAKAEGVAIYAAEDSGFILAGKLYELGLR